MRPDYFNRIVLSCLLVWTPLAPLAHAQVAVPQEHNIQMDAMESLSSLRGIALDPASPGLIEVILQEPKLSPEKVNERAGAPERLINYFFAALTMPETDIWVNLSPYEADRMIPGPLSLTEMGRDLLQEDHDLKYLAASLTDPATELGRAYWQKVRSYSLAADSSGPAASSICKVWVVPKTAEVVETPQGVFILDSSLDVMMERDHLAMLREAQAANGKTSAEPDISDAERSSIEAYRQIILPVVRDKVNNDASFARLREIYHAVILALWFKARATDSQLGSEYVDRRVVGGIDRVDVAVKGDIFRKYRLLFDKGVISKVYEDADPLTGEILPRKYFSGGMALEKTPLRARQGDVPALPEGQVFARYRVGWDAAMKSVEQSIFRQEHRVQLQNAAPATVLKAAASGIINKIRNFGYSGLGRLEVPATAENVPVVEVGLEDLPVKGAPVVGVFPGGLPGMELASFWAASGNISPGANFVVISPYNSLKRGGREGRELFVEEALFFDRTGRLVIGRFRTPLRMDGLVPGGIRSQEFRREVEATGIPLLESQALIDLVEDKTRFNRFLARNGNNMPPFIEIAPDVAGPEAGGMLDRFIVERGVDQLVVKPANAAQGIGVMIFTRAERSAALAQVRALQQQGWRVLVQQRVSNNFWVDTTTGVPVDWNLRVGSLRTIDGRVQVSPDMIYVRYLKDNFRGVASPVNLSAGAQFMTFREFARDRKLTPEQEQTFLQGIASEIELALAGIEREVPAEGLTYPAAMVGWDMMMDREGRWTVIEANAGPVGIIDDLEQAASAEQKGSVVLPLAGAMSQLAQQYQKQAGPSETAPQGLTPVAMPTDDLLAQNVAGFLDNIEQTETAGALFRLSASVNPNEKTLSRLGQSLVEEGRYEEAMDVLERSLEIAPTNIEAWHNLVYAVRRSGATEADLERVYARAFQQNTDAVWRIELAQSIWLDVLSRPQRAISEFRSIIQTTPQAAEYARRYWGQSLSALNATSLFTSTEIQEARNLASADLVRGIGFMLDLYAKKSANALPVETLATRLQREGFAAISAGLTSIERIEEVRGRFLDRNGERLTSSQALDLLEKGVKAYTDGRDVVMDNAMGGVDLTVGAFRHAQAVKFLRDRITGGRPGQFNQALQSLTPVIIERR